MSLLVERTPGDEPIAGEVASEEGVVFERMDIALEAWPPPEMPPGVLARWRCVVPEPNAKRGMQLDAGSALDLFEQLADRTEADESGADDSVASLRYVLALLLIRKRVLVPAAGGERGVLAVQPKPKASDPEGAGVVFRVREPAIDEASLAELSEQVSQILGLEAS